MSACVGAHVGVLQGDAGERGGRFQAKPVKVQRCLQWENSIPEPWQGEWVFLDFLSFRVDVYRAIQ